VQQLEIQTWDLADVYFGSKCVPSSKIIVERQTVYAMARNLGCQRGKTRDSVRGDASRVKLARILFPQSPKIGVPSRAILMLRVCDFDTCTTNAKLRAVA